MGQLCSCARAQDKRGNFVNNTILTRSPSTKSGCYIANNISVRVRPSDRAAYSTDGNVRLNGGGSGRGGGGGEGGGGREFLLSHYTGPSLPESQQNSLEESGVFSKSSTDGHSTTSNEEGSSDPHVPTRPSQTQAGNVPSDSCSQGQSERTAESTGRGTSPLASSIATSSVNDVTQSSPAGVGALDLKMSISLPGNNAAATNVVTGSDQLEAQGQKIRSVLDRTIVILATEIDSASIAEYIQKTRPDVQLTEADWSKCCDQAAAQDLIWDILTGQEPEDYDVFCDVIGSKVHLQHLVDLLRTLDSLIAIVSPDIDDDDDDEAEEKENDSDEGDCDSCTGTRSSDFDLDLVFCHRDFNNQSMSCNADEQRSQLSTAQVDSSNLSLAGGSYIPSITSDELGQPNLPMLTLSLIDYCLCRRKRASLLRQVLEESSCIRELSLVKTHVSSDDLALLVETIRDNSSLIGLDLRLSSFGNEAAGHMADALRHNSTLRSLNVASTGLSDIGCSRLMSGLVRNRVLSDIDIGFNDIRDTGCHSVAETLSRSNPLRKIRMRDNGITCYGACALFQSLARNCRLSFLDISSNGIGNDSLRHLSEALISNRTLRELNLENCRISMDGCISLARALRANTALRCLQLSLNPIGDVGLEALADGLCYNHALETLSVNMCNVGNSGFMRLLDSLRFNFTLKTVKLCYNNIGASPTIQENDVISDQDTLDQIIARLYEVLHYNPKLKILLWGNNLERNKSTPGSSDAHHGCHANRAASFSMSSTYSPALKLYRQDILVSV